MGQKKLINTTGGNLFVSFQVREGNEMGVSDTTGNWSWTVPAGATAWGNYDPETYLNGVQAQYLNNQNGGSADAGIQALFKSNSYDDALNMNDTITFSLQGTNLVMSFSNTWT